MRGAAWKLDTAMSPNTRRITGNRSALPIARLESAYLPTICMTPPRLAAPDTAPTRREELQTPEAAPTRCGGKSRMEMVELGDQQSPLAAPRRTMGISIQAGDTSRNMKIPNSAMDTISDENPSMDTRPGATLSVTRPIT